MKKIKFLGHKGSTQSKYAFPKYGKTLKVGEVYDAKDLGSLGMTLVKAGNAVYADEKVLSEKPPKLQTKPSLKVGGSPKPPEKSGPAKD